MGQFEDLGSDRFRKIKKDTRQSKCDHDESRMNDELSNARLFLAYAN